jgi:hypothetical protein
MPVSEDLMMNLRVRLLHSLLMNIPMGLSMSTSATLLMMWQGKGGFAFPDSLWCLLLAYATGVLVSFFVPAPAWGLALGRRWHFSARVTGLFTSLLTAFVNTVLISAVMTAFNVFVLGPGGAGAYFSGFALTLLPLTAVAFLVATAFLKPVGYLVGKLTGEQGRENTDQTQEDIDHDR